jgi:16S rRNA (cytosine967-C5)-methyltransferase
VDACAGAGGKTLHLAALMKNKGSIIALDVQEKRLTELKLRARRAGAHCIETRLIEGSKVIKRLKNSADRLLLDVPCSGLGVLRRNPDSKWKLTPEKMETLNQLQKKIINEYSEILKPGGLMVYATCSVLPSENQNVIAEFLKNRSDWILEQELSLDPSQGMTDGFYVARIKKT